MNVQMVKIVDALESPTNPRTFREDQAFKDLVASIKEKGVLVPVIARPVAKGKFEVVAGNRRLKAAKTAGLKEIPADVREMDDREAREIQIIENLQRADVHPLEEAAAYLKLVETIADIKAVAAKVGKAENYVHGRILLNNLADEVKKAYSAGEVNDGHAVEIAKLSPGGDQQKALKEVKSETRYGGTFTVTDLREWIKENIFDELEFQPWLKDKDAAAAVGPCKGCPPNVNTLFGQAKEGACTMTGCHSKKMDKYLEYMKQKNQGIILVDLDYTSKDGVLKPYEYEKASKTTKGVKLALVAAGKSRGHTLYITVTAKRAAAAMMTPEEKQKTLEKARKEKEAEEKREAARLEKESKKMDEVLSNVTWPLKEKHLQPMLEALMYHAEDLPEIADRRKIEGKKDEHGYFDDVNKAILDYFEKSDVKTKVQLIVEILIAQVWGSDREKMAKKFN